VIDVSPDQVVVCELHGVVPVPAPGASKVGIDRGARSGVLPVNGLRHRPAGDTTGWYIWAGPELSTVPDFFEAVHVSHLADRCPVVLPYLALPPGWRFLLAPNHEDCWFDPALLET
jgi:hypothetical protein